MRYINFKNKNKIPAIGLGTWQLTGDTCSKAISSALKIGYRHIDTAEIYGNQKEIGQAITDSNVKREDIFITSKVWRDNLHPEALKNALENTLDDLQTNYVDLYLIHWPNDNIDLEPTLKQMQELLDQGLIRNIGISNFTVNRMKRALTLNENIVTNQVEFHPSLNQTELKEFCDKNNIVVTAYSPIAQGQDLDLPIIKELAEKYDRSSAQVIINWLNQQNMIAIPRSSSYENQLDNFQAREWELKSEDVEKINNLNKNNRLIDPGYESF